MRRQVKLGRRERRNLEALCRVLGAIRDELGPVPIQRVELLVMVALDDGASLGEDYAAALGLSEASVSRHLRDLSKVDVQRRPGPNLIETRENPDSARQKHSQLTAKGLRLVERAAGLMNSNARR